MGDSEKIRRRVVVLMVFVFYTIADYVFESTFNSNI